MPTIFASHTAHISINRPLDQVYAFLARPENFPQWASGLGASIRQAGDVWIAQTPEGAVTVRFTAANAFGVLDHDVVLPNGESVHIPMRAIANGDGCEILFTLFRLPPMSDQKFAADIAWVERDLQALKALLEAD